MSQSRSQSAASHTAPSRDMQARQLCEALLQTTRALHAAAGQDDEELERLLGTRAEHLARLSALGQVSDAAARVCAALLREAQTLDEETRALVERQRAGVHAELAQLGAGRRAVNAYRPAALMAARSRCIDREW